MNRGLTFLQLTLGTADCESGYGANYAISPNLKSFFEGWMGESCPSSEAYRAYLKANAQNSAAGERERVLALANRLEELAGLLRSECEAI